MTTENNEADRHMTEGEMDAMEAGIRMGREHRRKLMLDAAVLLDDCLMRIFPEDFSIEYQRKAANRFSEAGGTINRIANMANKLRELAGEGEK